MHERPLKHLRRLKATGLDELLARLESARVRIGVLSDYPASRKLQALDLADRFSPVLCSTDPAIDALKPHPRGFLHACAHWSLAPAEVLMVGDRADADAAGASASGMAMCAHQPRPRPGWRSPGVPRASVLRKAARCPRRVGRPGHLRRLSRPVGRSGRTCRSRGWTTGSRMPSCSSACSWRCSTTRRSRASRTCCRLPWPCCPPAWWRRATTC